MMMRVEEVNKGCERGGGGGQGVWGKGMGLGKNGMEVGQDEKLIDVGD